MSERCVIIVAGGKGLRMGGDLPKQFIPMAGKPVLMHTLEAFHRWDPKARLVLVLPKSQQDYWAMLVREIGCRAPHEVADGGETRFHSVLNGLRRLSDTISGHDGQVLVGVHDGVRPFVTPEVIEACFNKAAQTGAAVPVVPLVDSIRELDGNDASHPVSRERYVAVQTPQVFDLALLETAYQQPYSLDFTDDASVVEALGRDKGVSLVAGDRENIKITTPIDLIVAEALFAKRMPDPYA